MKFMKMLACIAATALAATAAQAGCTAHVGRSDADAMSLVAAPTAFAVAMDGDRRTVTTLGTITNPSGVCFTDLVVEIQYFDASGQHVDTLVEPVANVVSPAGESVEFRVQGAAAKDAKAYATQRARVVDGSVRWVKGSRDPAGDTLLNLFFSWLPMLVLIGVWMFFMRRYMGKKSPQARLVANSDLQLKAAQEQAEALRRIAAALERSQVPGASG